jgi:hypothetical protein
MADYWKEAGELLVLFQECVFRVNAEDVMAMLDLINGRRKLARQWFVRRPRRKSH